MSNPKKVFLATPLNSEGREFKEYDFLIREKEFRLEPRLMSSVHWHDYYEVEFITGGEGCHFFNSHMHSIYRGCAYIIAPSDFHTVSESKDNPLGHRKFFRVVSAAEARRNAGKPRLCRKGGFR